MFVDLAKIKVKAGDGGMEQLLFTVKNMLLPVDRMVETAEMEEMLFLWWMTI